MSINKFIHSPEIGHIVDLGLKVEIITDWLTKYLIWFFEVVWVLMPKRDHTCLWLGLLYQHTCDNGRVHTCLWLGLLYQHTCDNGRVHTCYGSTPVTMAEFILVMVRVMLLAHL